ncbi:2-hydroxyacyl-CoA dehydratase [Nocardiopsis sp. LOL_012]|uniref:2-hydroxyacyl-CoA dehydratase n=1 Tax=Nocardiopsis sp. LOL_012 TaxID=3345409 RepID=UPI003A87382F
MATAWEELSARSADTPAQARARWAPEGPVVGYVGADVPVEALTAAGALGVRLRGIPGSDPSTGDRYLGRGLDPAARALLSDLVGGAFEGLDAVVVSRDCEASARLFYALRELRRIEPETVPVPVHLVDVLHLPHRSTTRYVRTEIGRLREVLGSWTGRTVDADALAKAITAHDRLRSLLSRLSDLRRSRPARLGGTHLLEAVAATTRMPVERATELLEAVLADPAFLPGAEGVRVFATGSSHDTPAVYAELERLGLLIAGEDHDWGELLSHRLVGGTTEAALAERYQYNGPTSQRASIVRRAGHTAAAARACGAKALVCYVREHDNAPPWDFTAQREAAGLPAVLLDRQPHGGLTEEASSRAAALRETIAGSD